MVIELREIANNCVGLQGDFSVVRDLLGYEGNRVPGFTSLREELMSLNEIEHVITVHLKIVSTPDWAFTSGVSINLMIQSMRSVLRTANVGVTIESTENLTLADTDIDVGACAGNTTGEQNTLFNNRNNVGPREIVVYFVRSVLQNGTDLLNGCASFPAGRPGTTVASIASRWTLVHEIGHILGNPHIEPETLGFCPRNTNPAQCILTNIMTCCSTDAIPAGTTPSFNDNQTERIVNSPLTIPLLAEVPDVLGMNSRDARKFLRLAGLRGHFKGPMRNSEVQSQSPIGGAFVRRGSAVSLKMVKSEPLL